MRTINKIIIHCSATAEAKAFTVEDIDLWHRQRGFASIGYHYVIYLDGTIHEGRPVALQGAHTLGQNSHSIGICYIGGVAADGKTPKDTRTQAQKLALKNLVDELQQTYPTATIHGHNEFANKACPSFDVRKEFAQ